MFEQPICTKKETNGLFGSRIWGIGVVKVRECQIFSIGMNLWFRTDWGNVEFLGSGTWGFAFGLANKVGIGTE